VDRRSKLKRGLLAALAAGLILGLVLGLVRLQRAMIFPREYTRQVPAALRTPGLERHWLDTDAGKVEAWILPGRGIDAEHPGPAVLFTHGNAELIDHWPDALARYRELGVSVVLAEYRGYGRSAGRPSEEAIAEDLRALHARLRAHPLVDASRLVYHGRSLGGGAACTLLDRHPPRALILESTFTSVVDVAGAMGVPAFLIVDRFDSAQAVRGYRGPLLVFHGTRDRVIPVEHGRRLAALREGAELVLYDAGHNDFPPPGADYWPRIERFLRGAGVIETGQ
jgi:fermentation-respiration switch protein FrsA (DUF1100 family)